MRELMFTATLVIASLSFVIGSGWLLVAALALASCLLFSGRCRHAGAQRWQVGYGGIYLFHCRRCGKTWEELR